MADYNTQVWVEDRIHQLKVAELKEALKACGGIRSGNKPALIERCMAMVRAPGKGPAMAAQLKSLLTTGTTTGAGAGAVPRAGGGAPQTASRAPQTASLGMASFYKAPAIPLGFASSPFLADVLPISQPTRLNTGQTRQLGGYNSEPSRIFKFTLTAGNAQKIYVTPGLQLLNQPVPVGATRLFLRCGEIKPGTQDLVERYPKMVRWYMNSKLVKEATHSRYGCIDVSHLLPISGPTTNQHQTVQIELIQAKTQQPSPNLGLFAMQLIVAHRVSPAGLLPIVTKMTPSEEECKSKVISKLREGEDEEDDGLSCGLMLVSINCPLSQMRMQHPCRGVQCNHLQCFDANFYLMYNARKTAWVCPICNKHTPLEALRVDSWLKRIISEVPPETIEVELLSDGHWKPKAVEDASEREREPRKRPRKTPPATQGSAAPASPGAASSRYGSAAASMGMGMPAPGMGYIEQPFGGTPDFGDLGNMGFTLAPPTAMTTPYHPGTWAARGNGRANSNFGNPMGGVGGVGGMGGMGGMGGGGNGGMHSDVITTQELDDFIQSLGSEAGGSSMMDPALSTTLSSFGGGPPAASASAAAAAAAAAASAAASASGAASATGLAINVPFVGSGAGDSDPICLLDSDDEVL